IKDLLRALRAELIRFRFWFVALFILMSFSVLALGVLWPKKYSTSTLMVAETTTIIEPLLKGRAPTSNINRAEQAREVIHTPGILGKNPTPDESDDVVKSLRSGLLVKPERNNFFRISYESSSPDRSFEVLNSIINVFIEDSARKKREESQGAFAFIDAQVQSYKRQLELAEQKLKEFKGQNLDGTEASVNSRIQQLRGEIENLNITIEETQARINTIQQQLNNEGQYQQAKGQVDDMRQRRQTLATQLEQLLLTYQENYPDVVSLRGQ